MAHFDRLGFGTYGRTGSEGIEAILCALEVGYRHLDTAQSYGTETEVAEALRQSGLARGDVWVTTKIDASNLGPGRLIPSLEASVERLDGPPDLTLIHWPAPDGAIEPAVYLDQIAAAKERGLTRAIGVSNFTVALLTEAVARLGQGEILTNQIELNPCFRNERVAAACSTAGIVVTCYQPIAQGRLSRVPQIAVIAGAHGATPEQIGLAWELAKGYAAIPTSSRADRIESNFRSRDIVLDAVQMAVLDAVPQAPRAIDPDWGPDWDD